MCSVSDLQPGVSQCFTHTEPPPHRHLQQVIDETHSWGRTDRDTDLLSLFQQRSSGATKWPEGEPTGDKSHMMCCHERCDQKGRFKGEIIVTLQWDEGPGLSWVHEGSICDLLPDVLVLVEGERAAQAHVHDDAHGPHVQRAVVAAAADHLWRQVGRRPHDRAAERLLADDAGEAEVTQLHLQQTGLTSCVLTICCCSK